MGQGGSKPPVPQPTETKGNSICIDCDKKTQKDLPADDATSATGQPCASFYTAVSECMIDNDGLIAPCAKDWVAFQKCHKELKQRKE